MNTNNLKLTVLLTGLTVLFVVIGNALGGATGMIVAVALALLLNGAAYWFSDKVILKMSGAREFQADEGGAAILGDALPLASALEKIERAARYGAPMPANPGTASLYIINPLSGSGANGRLKLFSTHPPTEQRIERLRVLAYTGRYSQAVAF